MAWSEPCSYREYFQNEDSKTTNEGRRAAKREGLLKERDICITDTNKTDYAETYEQLDSDSTETGKAASWLLRACALLVFVICAGVVLTMRSGVVHEPHALDAAQHRERAAVCAGATTTIHHVDAMSRKEHERQTTI